MTLEYNEVNYMRTHYLTIEKLDGTIKARFVAGKPIREYHELDIRQQQTVKLFPGTIYGNRER